MTTSHRSRAFTLIELLVVTAILGVVLALLLSAVMKVREANNRAVCANNLRQLALAAAGYQDHYGALPPNYHEDASRSDGSHNLFYGPILPLLPFVEQDKTYRNFSFLYYDSPFPDPNAYGWPAAAGGGMTWQNHTWNYNPFNLPPAAPSGPGYVPPPDPLSCPNPTGRTNIAAQTWGGQGNSRLFSCPSHPDDFSQTNQGTASLITLWGKPTVDMPPGNPFANDPLYFTQCRDDPPGFGCEQRLHAPVPATYVVGRSDYVAVVGAFNDPAQNDILFHQPISPLKYRSLFNWPLRASLANVPDGTSNTLLFSEYCGSYLAEFEGTPSSTQLKGWITSSWASNGVSVAWGTCPDPNNATPVLDVPIPMTTPCNYGASGAGLGSGGTLGGWHPGMFNVVFADGSVRPLRLGLDKAILLSLAGYNDGDPISASDY
jgi:prepilin-type N-terminal cleavage/methylation domain-containing protein/prepilin-type processing-associated H-X9-DG protein